jgi:ribonuclease-3
VAELLVIFRTQSDVEASIVRGLLQAHGIMSVVSSSVTHAVFPLSVSELGEVRLSVSPRDADEAQRVIESHRTEIPTGQVVRFCGDFETLQRAVDYRFRDRGLLEHAMTHRSRANEEASGGVLDNESMEFLGDAILGFVVADLLFCEFPDLDEGKKSKIKASLVSTATLARQAERLALGEHLLLGRGEEKTGGRKKQALLADGYEALIAAIYLDGGIEHAQAFIVRDLAPLLDEVRRRGAVGQDYKSTLQELLQSRNEPLPEYRLVATMGPDHQKSFQIDVCVAGRPIAGGMGPSKKEAEQEAARVALTLLTGTADPEAGSSQSR